MNKKVVEEDILRIFVDRMEEEGLTLNSINLNIDNSMVEKINRAKGTNIDLRQLQDLASKCIANEWLVRLETNKSYTSLQLTTKGHGIIKSREALAKRTWLKKAADFGQDHNGLVWIFGAISAIIALAKFFS